MTQINAYLRFEDGKCRDAVRFYQEWSDMECETGLVKRNTFVLNLECSSEDEIKSMYSKLARGGEETYPVAPSFWGGLYGQLTDKFGNGWMLNCQRKQGVG
jgi:PhnB protein